MVHAARVTKYFRMTAIYAKNASATFRIGLAAVFAAFISSAALFSVYIFAYNARGGEPINGIGLSTALWAIALNHIYVATGIRLIARNLSDKIKDGTIETLYNKPMYYPLSTAAQVMGLSLPTVITVIFVNTGLTYVIAGLPAIDYSLIWAFQVFTLFIVGCVLCAVLFTIVGLTAFWLEDATPVFWMVDKSTMILGGGYVPIALLPSGLRLFSEWSPFGAIPAFSQAFQSDFSDRFPSLLSAQVLWLSLLLCLMVFMWNKGRKQLSINGG